MFERVVKIGGKYYIKRFDWVRNEYLCSHLQHWFGRDYLKDADVFHSEDEAVKAYKVYKELERKPVQPKETTVRWL